jgi:hypothetical protein
MVRVVQLMRTGLPDVWHSFKPKIPIWVNFGGSCIRRCWCILCPFGLFHGYFVHFAAICYILWSFGMFSPFRYDVFLKNLATLDLYLVPPAGLVAEQREAVPADPEMLQFTCDKTGSGFVAG